MSIIDIRTQFKLYTLREVAELFPEEGGAKAHLAAVRALIEETGCYRQFGTQILMTELDIRDLLEAIRIKGGPTTEPLDTDQGFLVLIAPRMREQGDLDFIGWARLGGIQKVVDDAKTYAVTKVDLIEAAPCSYGDYKYHLKQLKPYRERGYWHASVPQSRAYLRSLFEANIGLSDITEDDTQEISNG